MDIRIKEILVGVGLALALTVSAFAADKPRIGVVMKIGGIPWFTAMETGLKEQGKVLGWDATMIGPETTDPALQIQAIEDFIEQKVDVIGVVPNEPEALELVLKKARDQGIVVLTHESPNQKNVDWNFELTSSKGFGEAHAKLLAEKMGGKGQYAVFVGSLEIPVHNAWADAGIAYIKENHPEMELVGDRYGVGESASESRKAALELMSKYPVLKGFLTFGSQGPIGAGRAIQENDKIDEIFVAGVFSPGQGQRLLKSGAIAGGFMWNPRQAGRVFVSIADDLDKGIIIKNGLKIDGLGKVNPEGKNLIVNQLVQINENNVDQLIRMGF